MKVCEMNISCVLAEEKKTATTFSDVLKKFFRNNFQYVPQI